MIDRVGADSCQILGRFLSETGYAEGQNVAIDYRFADGQYDRLLALAAELARRKVAIIVFAGLVSTNEVVQFVRTSYSETAGTGAPRSAKRG